MGQVDDNGFVSISLSTEDASDDASEDAIIEGTNDDQLFMKTKRKNLEEFLGLKDVGPGIPSKEAIEKAAVESLVYQGLTFNNVDREGRKNLSDLLGVAEPDTKKGNTFQGTILSFYENAKCFSKKLLKYKRSDKTEEVPVTNCVKRNLMLNKSSRTPTEKKPEKINLVLHGLEEPQVDNQQNKYFKARKFPHKLKPNFYVDRQGSLKEKTAISDYIIPTEEPLLMLAYSLPIIPFSPNSIASYDDSNTHEASCDLFEEDEEEAYSSMLFVANNTSLENIIDVAKKELFEKNDGSDSDESDCDSYASICFNSQLFEEVPEDSVPDYLDMSKLRELVKL